MFSHHHISLKSWTQIMLLLSQPWSQECTTTLCFSSRLLQSLYRWSVKSNALSLMHSDWQITANSRKSQQSETQARGDANIHHILHGPINTRYNLGLEEKHGIDFSLQSHLWEKQPERWPSACSSFFFFLIPPPLPPGKAPSFCKTRQHLAVS